MSEYVYRITAIVPAEHVAALRVISEALGYGGGTFSFPMSPTGAEPATHYAASTVSRGGFLALLTTDRDDPGADPAAVAAQDAALGGVDWPAWGMTEASVRAILRGLRDATPAMMAVGPNAPGVAPEQLATLMAAHGLQRVESEE